MDHFVYGADGTITIGGQAIDTATKARALHMYHCADGRVATPDEIEREWLLIKESAYLAKMAVKFTMVMCKLRLA